MAQKSRTVALLRSILYTKSMCNPPAAIKWGQDNETVAHQAYVQHMHKNGHVNLIVRECGIIIHPEKGWLASSPDGIVSDTSDKLYTGLLEIKCPYTKRDILPEDACQDENFYCCLSNNGDLALKRTHTYYHQVQLQLYVSSDKYKWCDFCIYTTKGVLVERIYPDEKWMDSSIPELEDYFENCMLPEIVHPKHKPSYYL